MVVEYKIGDKIAHPLHGAGQISEIEQKRVDGKNRSYYVMHIPKGDMRVMIPTDACDQIGIRPIISRERAEELFAVIPEIRVEEDSNWNKRYRENMARIKSGDLAEVAGVIKSLVRRESRFGLSNGERKMLHSAKQILISEIVLAESVEYAIAEARVNAAMWAKETV